MRNPVDQLLTRLVSVSLLTLVSLIMDLVILAGVLSFREFEPNLLCQNQQLWTKNFRIRITSDFISLGGLSIRGGLSLAKSLAGSGKHIAAAKFPVKLISWCHAAITH